MAAIARRIVLVCKGVRRRPIIERRSIPDFSNELGKQSFQNEFLNQCIEAKEEKINKYCFFFVKGRGFVVAPALIRL